jgi:hypothetical protein
MVGQSDERRRASGFGHRPFHPRAVEPSASWFHVAIFLLEKIAIGRVAVAHPGPGGWSMVPSRAPAAGDDRRGLRRARRLGPPRVRPYLPTCSCRSRRVVLWLQKASDACRFASYVLAKTQSARSVFWLSD